MIICVKAIPAYLLVPALLVVLTLNGLDGMVLCLCGGGRMAIEVACDDTERCCDAAPRTPARTVDANRSHECNDCTDVPLVGLDTLSTSPRTLSKVGQDSYASIQSAACVMDSHGLPPDPHKTAFADQHFPSPANSSVVIRI